MFPNLSNGMIWNDQKLARIWGRAISFGAGNELIMDPETNISLEYTPTAEQKGDLFTKALAPNAFIKARKLIGMRKPQEDEADLTAECPVAVPS